MLKGPRFMQISGQGSQELNTSEELFQIHPWLKFQNVPYSTLQLSFHL